jgi:hypothetical protein
MFCEDSDHSFDTAEDGAVDHDGSGVADTEGFSF